MNIVVSDGIVVSGVGVPLNGIPWPSGQFNDNEPGSQLCAFLTSINASFGFNLTAHSFQTEWVPCGDPCAFHGASGQLPDIGHRLELFVGDFFVRGKVTHADYTTSPGGTIVTVSVEDDRNELRRAKVHTEDLGEDAPSGIVSIARAYRVINGFDTDGGDPNDPNIKEYRRILQFGGTYSQILSAIDLHFNEDKCSISINDLPTVEQIEKNIGGTIESIRFQFNLTTLNEVLSRVLLDTGYDWYWNMDAQRVNLINKKTPFDISESDILDLVSQFGSTSGLNETRQLGYGQDVVSDPTRFRVLGGHQEGFINSPILSPIDGLDTFALDGVGSIGSVQDEVIFKPAWPNLTVGFYDADGFYRSYTPTEKELQLALAGIEQWSYFKIYQTTPSGNVPPGYELPPDDGYTAAQHPTFQSRIDPVMPLAGLATGASESGIRLISNRRDSEQNWSIAFYNRIRDHATRHYGRSYILEGLLFNTASGLFRLVDAAWANVENQVEGRPLSPSGASDGGSPVFIEDYEINRDLGPISPFVTDDFRVTAHCRLPSNTVYGPQGDSNPAGFGNWTEDAPPFNPTGDGSHYIPVGLSIVGNRVINPRNDVDLYSFEDYPEGTLWCQLPINAGPSTGLEEDNIISTLSTLVTTQNKLTGSGLVDIINPAIVLNVYDSLSGVSIPVESRSRYGQSYPSQWVLGNLHYERDEDVQLDDQFVPWAFSPAGSETSLQIMTNRAVRRAEGKIVPKSSSRYADFRQIGLPLLSFDSFAEQNIGASGLYGEISHGVSEINITFGLDGFTSRYKIQSYFPKFGREAPLGERMRAALNGVINPIDFSDLELLNPIPGSPSSPQLPDDPLVPPIFFDREERAVRVIITQVNNLFTLSDTEGTEQDERYRGIDRHGYTKPPTGNSSSNLDFSQGAICIDGFLNISDEALYHTDDFELPGGNVALRYFTQGRPYGNGTIVTVERTNDLDSSLYDVTILEIDDVPSSSRRAIFGVPVLNGQVALDDRTTLAVQGDGPIAPGSNITGLFINGTVTAGVTPVEIVAVYDQGTEDALVDVKTLDYNGDLHVAATEVASVVPIPFRQFAAVGDRGFYTLATVPSGVSTAQVGFIEIVKPGFFKR